MERASREHNRLDDCFRPKADALNVLTLVPKSDVKRAPVPLLADTRPF